MKSPPANSISRGTTLARAFTIVELLTALAIFLLVIAGLVSLPVLGLKMNAIASSKLEYTASSIKALNQIRNQVLQANSVQVGNGNNTTFVANGTNGDALQVYPGTNTSNYVRFFMSTNTDALYECNSATNTLWVLASSITNQFVFQNVDFQGNASSSSREHYAIKMTLQFNQLNYRIPTNSYEYYTLETEMTPRCQQ